MDAVGQATRALYAPRSSSALPGWCWTNEYCPVSPKVAGAIWRQVSQSMHVESTKKRPGTFSASFSACCAIPPLSYSEPEQVADLGEELARRRGGGEPDRRHHTSGEPEIFQPVRVPEV